MQKTKLGISVGLMGALVYFMGMYAGYLLTVLLVGYVLLFEENEWLKKAAVKALAIMVCFSLLSTVAYLLPNVISAISSILSIFGGYWYWEWMSNLANAVTNILSLLQKLLMLVLGLKALSQSDIAVPVVDKLIEKYMG